MRAWTAQCCRPDPSSCPLSRSKWSIRGRGWRHPSSRYARVIASRVFRGSRFIARLIRRHTRWPSPSPRSSIRSSSRAASSSAFSPRWRINRLAARQMSRSESTRYRYTAIPMLPGAPVLILIDLPRRDKYVGTRTTVRDRPGSRPIGLRSSRRRSPTRRRSREQPAVAANPRQGIAARCRALMFTVGKFASPRSSGAFFKAAANGTCDTSDGGFRHDWYSSARCWRDARSVALRPSPHDALHGCKSAFCRRQGARTGLGAARAKRATCLDYGNPPATTAPCRAFIRTPPPSMSWPLSICCAMSGRNEELGSNLGGGDR